MAEKELGRGVHLSEQGVHRSEQYGIESVYFLHKKVSGLYIAFDVWEVAIHKGRHKLGNAISII